ncbi:MAG: hypothetical protein PHW03_01975 [Eubacteriales bacterium]|nr:hypothetical protein [Eubacteriales bacterium]
MFGLFQRRWAELGLFMRAYRHAAIERSPSAPAHAQKLLSVAGDFRNAMMMFYGAELADDFNDLFTKFIANPINIIEGFNSNNRQLIDQSLRSWYSDAIVLSNFLNGMNSYWDANQWRIFLHQYIQLEMEMITSVIAKDYEREIRIFDRMIDLASIMGSYMARGLMAHQPQSEPPPTP